MRILCSTAADGADELVQILAQNVVMLDGNDCTAVGAMEFSFISHERIMFKMCRSLIQNNTQLFNYDLTTTTQIGTNYCYIQ